MLLFPYCYRWSANLFLYALPIVCQRVFLPNPVSLLVLIAIPGLSLQEYNNNKRTHLWRKAVLLYIPCQLPAVHKAGCSVAYCFLRAFPSPVKKYILFPVVRQLPHVASALWINCCLWFHLRKRLSLPHDLQRYIHPCFPLSNFVYSHRF